MVRVLFHYGSSHGVHGIVCQPLRMVLLLLQAVLALTLLLGAPSSAFQPSASSRSIRNILVPPLKLLVPPNPLCYSADGLGSRKRRSRMSRLSASAKKSTVFELTIDLPPSNSDLQAVMGIDPILSVPSELVVVRYRVPFGLNVEPSKNLAVVTKAGPGGEQPGDVLRYCSQWTLGLPKGDGLVTTAAAFSGGLSWQCSMFNVVKAKAWEQVVQALTSNTDARTDDVVLIFERALDGVTPPELQ